MSDKKCQSSDSANSGAVGTQSGLSGPLEYMHAPALGTAKIVPNSSDRGKGQKSEG